MLLLRILPRSFQKGTATRWSARRLLSRSSSHCNDSQKTTEENPLQTKDAGNCSHTLQGKVDYPKRRLKPKVTSQLGFCADLPPVERVKKAFKYEFDTHASKLLGTPKPVTGYSSDILIIGGGIVGSAIAYELKERCGSALNVTVVEKDLPASSTSLHVGNNYLYQQLNLKPNIEMAHCAANYYHNLSERNSPDLPGINIDFVPSSSLLLAYENEANTLEDLAQVYKELNWKHLLLTPAMLKQKFPWMNVEGVALACLGLQKEGMFNKLNTVHAMREFAKKNKTEFIQGEVIGFNFIDQSELYSSPSNYQHFFFPRQAVIQSPSGEISSCHFGYAIIAAGASTPSVLESLDITESLKTRQSVNVPVQPYEIFSYTITCPDGPGIEMPMVMDPSGLRFRKADLINTYTVWEENGLNTEVVTEDPGTNDYFTKKLLPQLIKRVPNFRNAKLLSSTSGLLDKCTWDENLLLGPLPAFPNILVVGGLGNDEFLYAPAVAHGMADLILERRFFNVDLTCFRLERIEENIKLDQFSVSANQ